MVTVKRTPSTAEKETAINFWKSNFSEERMRYSKEEKTKWLEGWQQSGKTACCYAKENGLIPWTLSRWAKEEAEKESGFVEVKTGNFPLAEHPPGILIERGDIKIHIPLEFGQEGLKIVLGNTWGAL